MNSVERNLKFVIKVSLEKHFASGIQTRFQKTPMLVHIQLRPEVRSFALLDHDNASDEFCC